MPAMTRLAAFDRYLRANAIPITGLQLSAPPAGPDTVTIDFAAGATAEQIAWAEQAKQSFDWRPRRFLTAAQIASVFAGLTAGQQNAILRRVFALIVMQNEDWVLEVARDHGVSIPYDEVVP